MNRRLFARSFRLPLLILAGLALLLWLPVGFQGGIIGDGWRYYSFADQGSYAQLVSLDRPMLVLPWLLAYYLGPGGTAVGINVLTLLCLFGKGAAVALLLRELEVPDLMATAAGALTIVSPTDGAVFMTSALNIQFASCVFFVMLLVFIRYFKRRSTVKLFVIIGLMFITVNIYETTYPLIVLSPLLLLLIHPRIDRRFIGATLLWYEMLVLRLIYSVWLAANTSAFGYQTSLLDSSRSLGGIVESMVMRYYRELIGGWVSAPGAAAPMLIGLAMVAAVLIIGLMIWLARADAQHDRETGGDRIPFTSTRALWIILVGLAIIGASTILYTMTTDRLGIMRAHMFASAGGAIVLAVLAWLLSRLARRTWVLTVITGVLVGVGTLYLTEQHVQTYEQSRAMQQIPIHIASVLPHIESGTVVLITGDYTADAAFRSSLPSSWWYLDPAVQLLYNDYSLTFSYCYPDQSGYWGVDREQCSFNEDFVQVDYAEGTHNLVTQPYDRLIMLKPMNGRLSVVTDLSPYTTSEIALERYNPSARFDTAAALPARIETLFQSPSGTP